MPNGQRRNRNSRHANTQRNLQTASVIEASAIAEIAEVVVAAEAFVDYSDEIQRLKSSLVSMRKGYTRQENEIRKLKKEDLRVRKSNDAMMDALQELRDIHGLISIKTDKDGLLYCSPMGLNRNGIQYKFKDVAKLLQEQDDKINRRAKEIIKLKTFCKSLITKDKEGIKNMIKDVASSSDIDNLSKIINKQDDDLVCDINFSDEESDEEEEDFMSHKTFIQGGKHYSYNEKYELYDDDFQFIKKFDSKFKMMAYFRPSNKV